MQLLPKCSASEDACYTLPFVKVKPADLNHAILSVIVAERILDTEQGKVQPRQERDMLTAELPQSLQEEFERTVQLLHDRDGVQEAFVEAIELWLTQQHQRIVEVEARLNNHAFDTLRTELEQKYLGQWIVIAHGKFLGAASTPEQMNEFAPTARHRILVKMGQDRPKAVEFGWQMTLA